MLVCKHADGGDRLVPVESTERIQRQQQLFGVDYKPVIRCGVWVPLLGREGGSFRLFTQAQLQGASVYCRSCSALRSPCPFGHFFHGNEAIGMTDVELTGFGSVTAHHLPFGLEEVEMVGKERVVDEDGV